MDKEKILPEIKKRIEEQGKKITLTDRTIEDYIEKIMSRIVKDDNELTDDVYNDHIEMLLSMNGQLNNEVATIVKEKGKKPVDQPPVPKIDPEIEELKNAVKTMREEKEAEKRQADLQARVKAAKDFAKNDKWAKDKKVVKYAMDLVQLKEGMTDEQYSGECKKKYDEIMTDLYGEGAAPGIGGASVKPTISEEDRDKAARERASKTKNIIV